MRVTVNLDPALLAEARRISGLATAREALTAGLEELIRKAHRERLRSLAGKLEFEVDLERSRRGGGQLSRHTRGPERTA
jgi:Arc/MetJ family transcription regulator